MTLTFGCKTIDLTPRWPPIIPQHEGPPRSTQEHQVAPRRPQKYPLAARRSQEKPATTRNSHEERGAPASAGRSTHKRLGPPEGSQEHPAAARTTQEQQGAFRNKNTQVHSRVSRSSQESSGAPDVVVSWTTLGRCCATTATARQLIDDSGKTKKMS